MKDDLQKAQDMLAIMEQERNSLANRLVHAQAEMMGLRRRNAELEAAAIKSAAGVRADAAIPQTPAPLANGHADQSHPSAPTG